MSWFEKKYSNGFANSRDLDLPPEGHKQEHCTKALVLFFSCESKIPSCGGFVLVETHLPECWKSIVTTRQRHRDSKFSPRDIT